MKLKKSLWFGSKNIDTNLMECVCVCVCVCVFAFMFIFEFLENLVYRLKEKIFKKIGISFLNLESLLLDKIGPICM